MERGQPRVLARTLAHVAATSSLVAALMVVAPVATDSSTTSSAASWGVCQAKDLEVMVAFNGPKAATARSPSTTSLPYPVSCQAARQ